MPNRTGKGNESRVNSWIRRLSASASNLNYPPLAFSGFGHPELPFLMPPRYPSGTDNQLSYGRRSPALGTKANPVRAVRGRELVGTSLLGPKQLPYAIAKEEKELRDPRIPTLPTTHIERITKNSDVVRWSSSGR